MSWVNPCRLRFGGLGPSGFGEEACRDFGARSGDRGEAQILFDMGALTHADYNRCDVRGTPCKLEGCESLAWRIGKGLLHEGRNLANESPAGTPRNVSVSKTTRC